VQPSFMRVLSQLKILITLKIYSVVYFYYVPPKCIRTKSWIFFWLPTRPPILFDNFIIGTILNPYLDDFRWWYLTSTNECNYWNFPLIPLDQHLIFFIAPLAFGVQSITSDHSFHAHCAGLLLITWTLNNCANSPHLNDKVWPSPNLIMYFVQLSTIWGYAFYYLKCVMGMEILASLVSRNPSYSSPFLGMHYKYAKVQNKVSWSKIGRKFQTWLGFVASNSSTNPVASWGLHCQNYVIVPW